jgi:hypothetical protein
MSLGEASKHYGIPKTTINDRMKSSKEQLQLGRPTELTTDEETIIVERLKVMGMWGLPPDRLRLVVPHQVLSGQLGEDGLQACVNTKCVNLLSIKRKHRQVFMYDRC